LWHVKSEITGFAMIETDVPLMKETGSVDMGPRPIEPGEITCIQVIQLFHFKVVAKNTLQINHMFLGFKRIANEQAFKD
jgi:hypothetical protein